MTPKYEDSTVRCGGCGLTWLVSPQFTPDGYVNPATKNNLICPYCEVGFGLVKVGRYPILGLRQRLIRNFWRVRSGL